MSRNFRLVFWRMVEEGSYKEVIMGSYADWHMFMRLMKNVVQPLHRLQIGRRADAQIKGRTLPEPFDKTWGRLVSWAPSVAASARLNVANLGGNGFRVLLAKQKGLGCRAEPRKKNPTTARTEN